MTERLYYTNSYATDFHADVLEVREHAARTAVVLDRTAFYPTSGGQPFDTGTLGGARVVDVVDSDDGTILHVVEGWTASTRVMGRVDWGRRFDHMQQHTGQHVLSAACARVAGAHTVSFHLGAASSTIDLSREITAAELTSAEEAANHVVWADGPVTVRFVEEADASALPLRKAPPRAGRLRIVEVENFDVSACGGTHVARSGAVGMIVVTGTERVRGGSRLEFRCGMRALGAHRLLREAVAGAVRLLSVAPDDLPRGIERMQAEEREQRRRLSDLEARLAGHEGAALAARALEIAGLLCVIEALDGADAARLKAVAQAVTGSGAGVAVLVTTGAPLSVAVACGPGVPIDASSLLKALMTRFGGKGGGRPELAQGAGLDAPLDHIIEAARVLLETRAAG